MFLRIAPDLAEWYTRAAKRAGVSQTQYAERALRVVAEVLEQLEKFSAKPDVVSIGPDVGEAVVGGMVSAGIAPPVLAEAWRLHVADALAEVRVRAER